MKRRDFLEGLGWGAAALSLSAAGGSLSQISCSKDIHRPNFIIIFCDDLGYADVGCFGAEDIDTPHIDRMASEGIRFTDFYVTAAGCTPSRASLMTGCYPLRVGLATLIRPEGPKVSQVLDACNMGINSDEQTVAEILKTRDYSTACVGKWHLGHHPEFLPTRHGFDEYFGLPYSNDMSPDPANNHGHAVDAHLYPPLPLIKNEKVIETEPDQNMLTARYTEQAVGFIERNKDRPFFLYLAHTMPHIPLGVSKKFKGTSKRGLYGDVVAEIDWSVGQILSAVKRLDLDEKTLVIFTSDNGPWLLFGDHGGSAHPLREGKVTTFEGGQRVPCIMRWPGHIPTDAVCSEPATTMDFLPTMAKLSRAEAPRLPIDGKNIWPLMSGSPGAKSPHEAFFFYAGSRLDAVRSGKWKLHFPHAYNSLGEAGSGGKRGRYVRKEIGVALFDLEKDAGEQNDVSVEHPDVVKRLMSLAEEMRQDLGDFSKKTKGKNRRPPGRVKVT